VLQVDIVAALCFGLVLVGGNPRHDRFGGRGLVGRRSAFLGGRSPG